MKASFDAVQASDVRTPAWVRMSYRICGPGREVKRVREDLLAFPVPTGVPAQTIPTPVEAAMQQ
jgi:hypothetical protein